MQQTPNTIHEDVRRLLEEAEAWNCGDHVFPILDSILTTISTIGYGSFLDGLLDGLFDPHANPDLNGQPFSPICDVIPSKSSKKAACHPLLLAFSKGDKGRIGFDAIQNKVRSHLAKCRGVTKFVICFTDCWDSAKFQDNHYEGLLTLKKVDGVNFVFVLAGVPDSVLAVCPVKF
jgi:hypothetical protein